MYFLASTRSPRPVPLPQPKSFAGRRFILLIGFVLCGSPLLVRAQGTVLPLWPHQLPEPAQTSDPERDETRPGDSPISGHRTARLINVTQPTLTLYPASPGVASVGAAALVLPGGGYQLLAWDGEGIGACHWLNSVGVACLLVKYRVPEKGMYPENAADLEDAQQAMRLAKAHAGAWHIDANRIGVMGFSAGGHLSVTLSTHWNDRHVEKTPAAGDVNAQLSAKPAFAILVYPAYLYLPGRHETFNPVLTPVTGTPPTFIVQAENDTSYIDSALNYYRALKDANVPAELHLYATGGHGFGMHPVGKPEENWPAVAAAWLHGLGMVQ